MLSPWFSSKWMEEKEKEEEALLGVTLRTRQTRGSREGVGKGGRKERRRKKKQRGTMLYRCGHELDFTDFTNKKIKFCFFLI